ncbi:MAG: response regulator [Planctomycetales bacterium]|nr:response regulator [Planctomycetales bacterium]
MKILIIEDHPGDLELVCRRIASVLPDAIVECDIRLQAALNRENIQDFDTILTDLSLPDSQGVAAVKRLKVAAPDVPLIVLTALADDKMALEAIEEGAQDYVNKGDLRADVIGRAIRYAVYRQRGITENERLVRHLQESKALLEQKNNHLQNLCDTAQKFVDNVSHEFRTPLTVIMDYTNLLRDGLVGGVTEEQQRILAIIDDRACDLNNMVDDMLDVSKLEAGMLRVWRREVTVDEVIRHVLPSLKRKAIVRGVELVCDVPNDLPTLYCDDEKMGRVLINLVVNAIKFSQPPGPVTIAAELLDSEVKISVTDNGPGIPRDKQQELFERFTQARTGMKQETKGFGLGLSIAKELVDLNLGVISVASEEGHGSCFSFTVPIAHPPVVLQRYASHLLSDVTCHPFIIPLRIRVDESASVDDVDDFLRGTLRHNDLVFRCDNQEWMLILNLSEVELDVFQERLLDEYQLVARNRPGSLLPELQLEAGLPCNLKFGRNQLASLASQLASGSVCYA